MQCYADCGWTALLSLLLELAARPLYRRNTAPSCWSESRTIKCWVHDGFAFFCLFFSFFLTFHSYVHFVQYAIAVPRAFEVCVCDVMCLFGAGRIPASIHPDDLHSTEMNAMVALTIVDLGGSHILSVCTRKRQACEPNPLSGDAQRRWLALKRC